MVVAIIALLIGLLVPALGKARDAAQEIACRSNLRQVGIGSLAYAADNAGYLSSGPFDNRAGGGYSEQTPLRAANSLGPIAEVGWLADMVNGGYMIPGRLLCPTNPARYTQNLTLERLNERAWFGDTYTFETRQSRLLDHGFNTNYVMTWHMGCTAMRDTELYDTSSSPITNVYLNAKKMDVVIGPLRLSAMAAASPSRVAIFGDGTSKLDGADGTEEFEDFGDGRERVTKALGDGPAPYPFAWGRQDYADLGPAHGSGPINDEGTSKVRGNIAFADGSVAVATDADSTGTFGYGARAPGAGVGDYSGIFLDDTHPDPDIEDRVFLGDLKRGWWATPGRADRNGPTQ